MAAENRTEFLLDRTVLDITPDFTVDVDKERKRGPFANVLPSENRSTHVNFGGKGGPGGFAGKSEPMGGYGGKGGFPGKGGFGDGKSGKGEFSGFNGKGGYGDGKGDPGGLGGKDEMKGGYGGKGSFPGKGGDQRRTSFEEIRDEFHSGKGDQEMFSGKGRYEDGKGGKGVFSGFNGKGGFGDGKGGKAGFNSFNGKGGKAHNGQSGSAGSKGGKGDVGGYGGNGGHGSAFEPNLLGRAGTFLVGDGTDTNEKRMQVEDNSLSDSKHVDAPKERGSSSHGVAMGRTLLFAPWLITWLVEGAVYMKYVFKRLRGARP